MLVFDNDLGFDVRKVMNEHGFHLSEHARFISDVVDGKLRCVAAFDNYDGNDIHIHASCDGMTRKWLRAIFFYAFEVCMCQRVTALVSAHNHTMQRYMSRLGFTHEGTVRNGTPDGDLLIYGMLKEENQWEA